MQINTGNEIANQSTVFDIIAEYDAKHAAIGDQIRSFEQSISDLEMAATVQGTYAGTVISGRPSVYERDLQKNLLKSGWKTLYSRLQIDRIASAKDRQLFDRTVEAPPPLTFENAKATFGDYLLRPRFHILRGLAETFTSLDPAYKSHSKVKIGVKGLPKRVILGGFGGYITGYGQDKLRDIVNALAAFRNQPMMDMAERDYVSECKRVGILAELDGKELSYYRDGKTEMAPSPDRGITLRMFGNGNAHVIFAPDTLRDINRALAEFYGEVLPDADPDDVPMRASTDVAKDLQFYWSPQDVIERALYMAGVYTRDQHAYTEHPNLNVLEPSCGDGRIMDAIRSRGSRAFGIEHHAGRAAQARAKGHSVLTANFLEQPARAEFDRVIMNPPFYGKHYVKHVRHALKFLRPGGCLVAILPATARYDHGLLDDLRGTWEDLPVGSFAEVGTNVPTALFRVSP